MIREFLAKELVADGWDEREGKFIKLYEGVPVVLEMSNGVITIVAAPAPDELKAGIEPIVALRLIGTEVGPYFLNEALRASIPLIKTHRIGVLAAKVNELLKTEANMEEAETIILPLQENESK